VEVRGVGDEEEAAGPSNSKRGTGRKEVCRKQFVRIHTSFCFAMSSFINCHKRNQTSVHSPDDTGSDKCSSRVNEARSVPNEEEEAWWITMDDVCRQLIRLVHLCPNENSSWRETDLARR